MALHSAVSDKMVNLNNPHRSVQRNAITDSDAEVRLFAGLGMRSASCWFCETGHRFGLGCLCVDLGRGNGCALCVSRGRFSAVVSPDIEFPVEEFSAGKGMTPTPSIQPPFGVSKLKVERTSQVEGVAFPNQQMNIQVLTIKEHAIIDLLV